MSRDQKLYTADEAQKLGRRFICYLEGHRFQLPDMTTAGGGVHGVTPEEARRRGVSQAACDEISCERCDVVFTATYEPMQGNTP